MCGFAQLMDKGKVIQVQNKSSFATQNSLLSMSFDTYKKEYIKKELFLSKEGLIQNGELEHNWVAWGTSSDV